MLRRSYMKGGLAIEFELWCKYLDEQLVVSGGATFTSANSPKFGVGELSN